MNTIRRVTAPSTTPVSLTEAKLHLRVDDTAEDTLITSLIEAAVSHFDGEGDLGRAMITQGWAQWFNQSPGYVRLQMGTFISITSVEYYDRDNVLQTADIADFETWLDGDFVTMKPKLDKAWPGAYARPDAIKVTYQAGYGGAPADVPQSIRHAILMTVAHWYEHRMAVDDARMAEVPLAVNALIGNERVSWYG